MMAFTPDRHAEVDALLREMERYLTELALELDTQARHERIHGPTYQAALQTAAQVAHLRALLQQDQEQQRNHHAGRQRPAWWLSQV